MTRCRTLKIKVPNKTADLTLHYVKNHTSLSQLITFLFNIIFGKSKRITLYYHDFVIWLSCRNWSDSRKFNQQHLRVIPHLVATHKGFSEYLNCPDSETFLLHRLQCQVMKKKETRTSSASRLKLKDMGLGCILD